MGVVSGPSTHPFVVGSVLEGGTSTWRSSSGIAAASTAGSGLLLCGVGVGGYGQRVVSSGGCWAHCWVLRDRPVMGWFFWSGFCLVHHIGSPPLGGWVSGGGVVGGMSGCWLRTTQWTRASCSGVRRVDFFCVFVVWVFVRPHWCCMVACVFVVGGVWWSSV